MERLMRLPLFAQVARCAPEQTEIQFFAGVVRSPSLAQAASRARAQVSARGPPLQHVLCGRQSGRPATPISFTR